MVEHRKRKKVGKGVISAEVPAHPHPPVGDLSINYTSEFVPATEKGCPALHDAALPEGTSRTMSQV